MPSIELKRRVRWCDADAAGRIYYARIFDYFGEGEHELLRSVGFSLKERREGYDFPRVHVECQFHRVLALDAPFTLRTTVGKLGHTSIRYDFSVFGEDAPDDLAAEGSITVVVVKDGKPARIPEALRSALS